jgi:hypothetical protein
MQALLVDENAALKKELIQVKAQLRQETNSRAIDQARIADFQLI